MVFEGPSRDEPHRVAVKNRRNTHSASLVLRLPSWGLALLSLSLIQLALPGRADAVRTQKLPVVRLQGGPVQALAPAGVTMTPPAVPGWGMCGAFRTVGNMDATAIFAENPPNLLTEKEVFSGSVNTFMDASPRDRFDETLLTVFDLSNNLMFTDEGSRGDYTMPPDCRPLEPGCQYPGSVRSGADRSKGFGTRFRGYLRVPQDWTNNSLHFGFFVDRAVALKIWDVDPGSKPPMQKLTEHLILSHSPDRVGKPCRVSNTIVFKEAGIYPIEITGASILNSASTEFVYFIGDFDDIEEYVSAKPSAFTVDPGGFQRVPLTQFYQTLNGDAPYAYGDPTGYKGADLLLGQQCPQGSKDVPGDSLESGVCDFENIPLTPPATRAHYCNSAAVCAPCVVDTHCGVGCPACGPLQHCRLKEGGIRNDPRYYSCDICRNDSECPRGNICVEGMCSPAPNCCPEGTSQIDIAPAGQPPNYICSECNNDADCKDASKGTCDRENGRCIAAKAECNTDDNCNVTGPSGSGCQSCKTVDPNRPYCLNGSNCVQCKSDYHCAEGQFCLSGQCTYCTQDAHCGPTCVRCDLNTPYCATPISDLNPRQMVDRKCVRCLSDDHCNAGERCDPATHTCSGADKRDCPQGQVGLGDRCVECYSNIHCGCGRFCDLETNTCNQGCKDTADCQGTQCCSRETNTCLVGRCAPGTVHGGYSCGCGMADIGSAQEDLEAPEAMRLMARSRGTLVAGFATALLWLLLRRRSARAQKGWG